MGGQFEGKVAIVTSGTANGGLARADLTARMFAIENTDGDTTYPVRISILNGPGQKGRNGLIVLKKNDQHTKLQLLLFPVDCRRVDADLVTATRLEGALWSAARSLPDPEALVRTVLRAMPADYGYPSLKELGAGLPPIDWLWPNLAACRSALRRLAPLRSAPVRSASLR